MFSSLSPDVSVGIKNCTSNAVQMLAFESLWVAIGLRVAKQPVQPNQRGFQKGNSSESRGEAPQAAAAGALGQARPFLGGL